MLSFSVASYAWVVWHHVPSEETAYPVPRFSALSPTQDPVNTTSISIMAMRSAPTFIHIPKTGGTSIETELAIRGIHVGRCAFLRKEDGGQRTYKIKQGRCNGWHSLPLEHVNNSITVVRDPMDRLLSEFCWERAREIYRAELSCEELSSWILDILSNEVTDKNHIYDCHLLPQWEYAKWADSIVPFCALGTPHGNKLLAEHFEVASFTLREENHVHMRDGECKTFTNSVQRAFNVTNCISSTAYALFQDTYRLDYKYLRKHFTCA